MLTAKQYDYIKAPMHRTTLLYGSVRSGKTWISLLKWALWVAQQPETDEFIMVGRTMTTLNRNCLGLLRKQVGAENFKVSLSQKKATLYGRTVWLEGANDEQAETKIRGMTLKGAYLDELTLIPESFYTMMLYYNDHSPYSTQHGIKGAEFENVLVVMDNGRWNNYNFKYLFEGTGNESVIQRTERIFYVCCSRVINSLVVYYPSPSTAVLAKAREWFGESNVHLV